MTTYMLLKEAIVKRLAGLLNPVSSFNNLRSGLGNVARGHAVSKSKSSSLANAGRLIRQKGGKQVLQSGAELAAKVGVPLSIAGYGAHRLLKSDSNTTKN